MKSWEMKEYFDVALHNLDERRISLGIIKSDKSSEVRQEHDHISDYRRQYL